MGNNPILIVVLIVGVGVALNFIRLWLFVSSTGGRAKASRIAEQDAHLSFDERIAERMRALKTDGDDGGSADDGSTVPPPAQPAHAHFTPPSATAAPSGFGRRGL